MYIEWWNKEDTNRWMNIHHSHVTYRHCNPPDIFSNGHGRRWFTRHPTGGASLNLSFAAVVVVVLVMPRRFINSSIGLCPPLPGPTLAWLQRAYGGLHRKSRRNGNGGGPSMYHQSGRIDHRARSIYLDRSAVSQWRWTAGRYPYIISQVPCQA